MSLKASCFAVKQQVYGHFLATRIFHLATEKRISVATWRPHKKVNFGPWPIVSTFCAHLTLINIFTQRQVLFWDYFSNSIFFLLLFWHKT